MASPISVEECWRGSYSPEFEYVDGQLVESNVGECAHGLVKSNVIFGLAAKYPAVRVLPTRITETRYRLADVCVALQKPSGPLLTEAPFLVVAIVSEDDRMSLLFAKLNDDAAFGVLNIWLFDPRNRQMFVFQENALVEIEGDIIATESPRPELTRDEIYRD
jgi:Uma2 family endonuclease